MKDEIYRKNNEITVSGNIRQYDAHYLFLNIYQAVSDKKYEDVVLNFTNCLSVFPSTMLTLCSYAQFYKNKNVDFDLILPEFQNLKNLFINSNWANLIDSENYAPSQYSGYRQVAATCFKNPEDQEAVLQKIVNSLLSSYKDFERSTFAAIEWSINEIMDNVLTHSESPFGGIAQLTTYNNANKKIEIVVSDAGLGIPKTLIGNYPGINDDITAVMSSIREGVTNGKGQGNGLFGTYNICTESHGSFIIDSGSAILFSNSKNGLHIRKNAIPITGTTISATINCNTKNLLEKSLKFKNIVYHPIDSIELNFEIKNQNIFKVKKESISLGSRVSAAPCRTKLFNFYKMTDEIIFLDFTGVDIATNSFLDEFLVKFIVEISPYEFKKRFKIINITQTIVNILNRSYYQRVGRDISEVLG